MQFSKSLLFGAAALIASLLPLDSALAAQIQSFGVSGFPSANPQVQGAFTVSSSLGLCAPYANGGLGACGYPSTITIAANGFVFDAFSIGVGGANSAIPAETETFIGDLLGGGTVTQTFQFPGYNQNFVTANLVGFDNLIDVRANLGAVTLQNLSYAVSPEPGTLGLIGLGLAAAALYRRKRAARSTDSI